MIHTEKKDKECTQVSIRISDEFYSLSALVPLLLFDLGVVQIYYRLSIK